MLRIAFLFSFFIFSAISLADSKYKPLSVPNNVRVSSSKPRDIVWKNLSIREQKLATHLIKAATAGREIIFHQNHRHDLTVKAMLERALSRKNSAQTKKILGEGFIEFLNYAAKFEDLLGPYESSNRKYVLSKVTPPQVERLFALYVPALSSASRSEAVKLLTDPTFEVIQYPEDEMGTDLEMSGGNLYEHGITGGEVTAAFKAGLKSNVNCRIVRDPAAPNGLICQKQTLSNPQLEVPVKRALSEIVKQLSLAIPFATTEHQTKQLTYLVQYLQKGDIEDFRNMNIEWVKDGVQSKVDFMMGYVEVYQDYMNQIGSWESNVQIVDPKTTQLSINLAKNAQYFENQMPYGVFKKTFPANYSPPALMVYYFQEISSFHSGGYNLPNYDDIRRDVGAKNIIKLDLPGQEKDPAELKVRREMYEEFLPKDKVDSVITNWLLQRRTIVLLHEIIGHGSGTYDVSKYGEKIDPVSALGALGSALEEERADLTALTFGSDPILVTAGLFKDPTEATQVRNAMYDAYLADFLRNFSKQQSFTEAHQRGHWLLINLLLENGAVKFQNKDGNDKWTPSDFVLAVTDYDRYHEVARNLLQELQRIKATHDDAALRNLFAVHAPLDAGKLAWAQGVIQRGKKLAINAGTIEQPWKIEKGHIIPLGDLTLDGIAPYYKK